MRPLPLLNAATFWWSSNTDVCTEKLSQILAINLLMVGEKLLPEIM